MTLLLRGCGGVGFTVAASCAELWWGVLVSCFGCLACCVANFSPLVLSCGLLILALLCHRLWPAGRATGSLTASAGRAPRAAAAPVATACGPSSVRLLSAPSLVRSQSWCCFASVWMLIAARLLRPTRNPICHALIVLSIAYPNAGWWSFDEHTAPGRCSQFEACPGPFMLQTIGSGVC